MQIKVQRSYRCSYYPNDRFGSPLAADTGVLPFVQLKATDAEDAQRKAHAVTGCAVVGVERMEGGAA